MARIIIQSPFAIFQFCPEKEQKKIKSCRFLTFCGKRKRGEEKLNGKLLKLQFWLLKAIRQMEFNLDSVPTVHQNQSVQSSQRRDEIGCRRVFASVVLEQCLTNAFIEFKSALRIEHL